MKRARHNGRLIEAGPDAPERAECPDCGAEVLLRRRRNIGGESWYWRHRSGEGRGCRRRSRIPGEVFIFKSEEEEIL